MKKPPSCRHAARAPIFTTLCWLLGLAHVSAQRVPGAASLFTFDHAACLAGAIPDSGSVAPPLLGQLAVRGGNHSEFCRPMGSGVVNSAATPRNVERVSSTGVATRWGTMVQATQAFSVEAWLGVEPSASSDTSTYLVFALDSMSTVSAGPDLAFVVQEGALHVMLGSDVPTAMSAGSVAWTPPPGAQNMHVALACELDPFSDVAQSYFCQVYVNAQAIGDGAIDVRPTFRSTSRLFLFSEPAGMGLRASFPWRGTIHLWALYNRTLSAVEVAQNYAARVPNSRPLARAANHTVQENGEVGSHYDTPAFYLSPVPVDELVVLDLVAVDGDLEPASPNYNAAAPLSPPQLYLASLPGEGTLYHLNGSAITEVPTLLVSSAATQPGVVGTQVRYRPGWKEVSWPEVYTTFAFYALDGSTGLAGAPATVSVLVRPVHRIPEVNSSTTPTEAKAGQLTWVTVAGTAFDGAVLTWARLASLPSQGSLYRSLNDTATPLGVGADVPMPPGQLVYLYTGPQASLSSSALATDAFNVTVVDSYSTSSVPAAVNLVVAPSLEALAQDTALTVPEHTPTPVTLLGTDHQSLAHRDLCFEITALPRHGVLRLPTDQSLVASVPFRLPDQVSPFPYTTGAAVLYESVPGYFTQPNHTWNGTWFEDDEDEGFAFRVVACQGEGEGNATVSSPPVEQRLAVQNVNDPTDISVVGREYSIYASTSPMNVTRLGSTPTQIALENITVGDPDLGVDPVLVKVSCTYGRMRLNQEHVEEADFVSAKYCPTNCLKNTSKLLWFVSTPWGLERLLNGLTYDTTVPSVVDHIEVTVHDGAGSPCLAPDVLPPGTDRPGGCLVAEAQFVVTAQAFTVVTDAEEQSRIKAQRSYLPFMLSGLALVILSTILFCAWACCCPQLFAGRRCFCPVAPRPPPPADYDDAHVVMGNPLVNKT